MPSSIRLVPVGSESTNAAQEPSTSSSIPTPDRAGSSIPDSLENINHISAKNVLSHVPSLISPDYPSTLLDVLAMASPQDALLKAITHAGSSEANRLEVSRFVSLHSKSEMTSLFGPGFEILARNGLDPFPRRPPSSLILSGIVGREIGSWLTRWLEAPRDPESDSWTRMAQAIALYRLRVLGPTVLQSAIQPRLRETLAEFPADISKAHSRKLDLGAVSIQLGVRGPPEQRPKRDRETPTFNAPLSDSNFAWEAARGTLSPQASPTLPCSLIACSLPSETLQRKLLNKVPE